MKSSDKTFAIRAYEATSRDVLRTYPCLAKSLKRDLQTISHCIEHRGLGFLALDLPELDSALVRGLETGVLHTSELRFRNLKDANVPRLFSGLWKLVFDQHGCLMDNVDPTAIFFLRQLCCMFKKVEAPCSDKRVRNTIDEYEKIESSLPTPTLPWGAGSEDFLASARAANLSFLDYSRNGYCGDGLFDDKSVWPSHSFHGELGTRNFLRHLDAVSKRFCNELPDFVPEWLSNHRDSRRTGERFASGYRHESAFKHGPGAVADSRLVPRKRGEQFDKFRFPTWNDRLDDVFPWFLFGATMSHRAKDRPQSLDVPSRLIQVPKTLKAPRLIASEPTANQWCQQMVADYFYRATGQYRKVVNTKDQSVSRALVVESSKSRHLATIDLSSASDRLSCAVVERIFATCPSLLVALNAVRTPYIRNEIEGTRPFLLKSRKYASQGTACTFPIQSLVFALVATAACGYRSLGAAAGKVRVFGDDIIVPKVHVSKVVSALHLLGLKVNEEKSFSNGYFRESCGMDAFKGYDVTPMKFAQLPSSSPTVQQAFFDYSNNAHVAGLWELAECLRGCTRLGRSRPIKGLRPTSSGAAAASDNAFLHSFSGSCDDHLRKRWNRDLQRVEVRCWSVLCRSKRVERASLERLMCNQHSMFGESFSPHIALRPTSELVVTWEASLTARP